MKICKIVPADHRIKLKECEKRDKYLDLARELKKLWNMKVTIIVIVIGAFGTVTKGLLKGLEDFGSWRPSGDHPNNSIIENGQNTEKSPGDLRRLAITQSQVKDHQMSLMWKTLMSNNNYNNNRQYNSKCRLCGERDEMISHIMSECSKLAQKEYKTMHDLIGKVIHWELCKKLKFDHANEV